MKVERIYNKDDLRKGKCSCCNEKSNEILIDDGRCINCIEEEYFFQQTMDGLKEANHKSPFGFSC